MVLGVILKIPSLFDIVFVARGEPLNISRMLLENPSRREFLLLINPLIPILPMLTNYVVAVKE